jgi:hypothetical protein
VDFPVYMVTDNSQGVPTGKEFTREEYVAMMRPLFEKMPKDIKVNTKPTYTVLSDSLVGVSVESTMAAGKQKMNTRSASTLIKRDGKWLWKTMTQAGWGDVMAPGTGGSPNTPANPR